MKGLTELIALIEEQQKGHEEEPAFMVGEQLKEIAEREPETVDLLLHDLQTGGMKITDAAGQIKAYADKHRGKQRCVCVSPIVAEGILRKFYGLPERAAEAKKQAPEETEFLDLASFL